MQPTQTMVFTCQACGHQFQSAWDLISKQPTCPRCRTFGKIAGPDGLLIGARQSVVKVQHPKAGGGPVARQPMAQRDDEAPVVVAASTAYGAKRNPKTIATVVTLIAIGIGSLVLLWIIIGALQGDAAREAKEKREIVQDPKEFERAVDESINRVRKMLKATQGVTVQETTSFNEALDIIVKSGGSSPSWNEAPRPGQPFKSAGFVLTGKETRGKLDDGGFVMLLYYKTSEEVNRAAEEIRRAIGGNTRFSIKVNPEMWYIAYSGVAYAGAIDTALKSARDMGAPSTFKQFTDRVGATHQGRDTDG